MESLQDPIIDEVRRLLRKRYAVSTDQWYTIIKDEACPGTQGVYLLLSIIHAFAVLGRAEVSSWAIQRSSTGVMRLRSSSFNDCANLATAGELMTTILPSEKGFNTISVLLLPLDVDGHLTDEDSCLVISKVMW